MPPLKALSALKKRSEFLAVAAHRRKWVAPPFILQVGPRENAALAARGLGLTASKKMVGNAVMRNRARRRLRALAHEMIATHGAPALNYVMIARKDVLKCDFTTLRRELEKALRRLQIWQDA